LVPSQISVETGESTTQVVPSHSLVEHSSDDAQGWPKAFCF
jgi:hypothetical protein